MRFIIPDIKFPIRKEYHLILLPKSNDEILLFKAIIPLDVLIEFYEDDTERYIPLYHLQYLLIKVSKILMNLKLEIQLRYLRKRQKNIYLKVKRK